MRDKNTIKAAGWGAGWPLASRSRPFRLTTAWFKNMPYDLAVSWKATVASVALPIQRGTTFSSWSITDGGTAAASPLLPPAAAARAALASKAATSRAKIDLMITWRSHNP